MVRVGAEKPNSPVASQMGKLLGDGASNNNTMAAFLSELVTHFEPSDHGQCLLHVLHLAGMRILQPFDTKPGQLEQALAEALRELEATGDDLTSLGNVDDEDKTTERHAEVEEEEENYLREVAANLAADLTANEREVLANACFPGAQVLTKVRVSFIPCICKR